MQNIFFINGEEFTDEIALEAYLDKSYDIYLDDTYPNCSIEGHTFSASRIFKRCSPDKYQEQKDLFKEYQLFELYHFEEKELIVYEQIQRKYI